MNNSIGNPKRVPSRNRRLLLLGVALVAALFAYAASNRNEVSVEPPDPAVNRSRIGINLFGPQTFNRQQVFTNLIAQSEWFSFEGEEWSSMPEEQLDRSGWVRYLRPGQVALRPLMMPPGANRTTDVHCRFVGEGAFSAGGLATVVRHTPNLVHLTIQVRGDDNDGAWLELTTTSPNDPVRSLDCRETERPTDERFHPNFVDFLQGFQILRFLDWQRINDNFPLLWEERALPDHSSQVSRAGASIEDMVDIANQIGADPWFLMPYSADDTYVRGFAKLVHQRLDPQRVVYVELGNEIWNDMFDAAQQAEREGLALGFGGGDRKRAQSIRYAEKLCRTHRIWSEVFADRPGKLVRVASSQNAYPELAHIILGHGDTATCVDALATAPYVWLDLQGRGLADLGWVFAQMPRIVEETIAFAERNRATAMRYGKRYIAYEGGQHLVTPDLEFAQALQRDPRMGEVYRSYLSLWDSRIRSDLVLYASTAPITEYGSWGLREYPDQPSAQTPKLTAVRQFMADAQ